MCNDNNKKEENKKLDSKGKEIMYQIVKNDRKIKQESKKRVMKETRKKKIE